jgi:hypothetical protein
MLGCILLLVVVRHWIDASLTGNEHAADEKVIHAREGKKFYIS